MKKYYPYLIAVVIILISIVIILLSLSEDAFGKVEKVSKVLSDISMILGLAAIFYAYKSHVNSEKKRDFKVVSNCMVRYSVLLPKLIKIELEEDEPVVETEDRENNLHENEDSRLTHSEKETILRRYYDLSNEQLFYMENGLVPDEIEMIWREGIINQLEVLHEKNPMYIGLIDNRLHKYLHELREAMLVA